MNVNEKATACEKSINWDMKNTAKCRKSKKDFTKKCCDGILFIVLLQSKALCISEKNALILAIPGNAGFSIHFQFF